jgi:hypothetical protein
MKLYRKTLTSLDELEREKIRLRYERKGTKSKHLLPDIGKARKKILGGGKRKGKDAVSGGNNLLGLAMGLLNGGSPLQTAISLAGPLMSLLSRKSSAPGTVNSGGSATKRFMGRVVKDIVVSYVIGKGAQLLFKGAKAYMKSKKAKAAAVRATQLPR